MMVLSVIDLHECRRRQGNIFFSKFFGKVVAISWVITYFSISFEKKITFYTAEILIRRIVELWIFSAVISLVKKIIHQTIFLDRILV